ncbi:MAG: hypothetical protein NTW04_05280 [Elusimicrobia bacterium]|nr:hypothetical protein [Elusimicrobiota bacterium]
MNNKLKLMSKPVTHSLTHNFLISLIALFAVSFFISPNISVAQLPEQFQTSFSIASGHTVEINDYYVVIKGEGWFNIEGSFFKKMIMGENRELFLSFLKKCETPNHLFNFLGLLNDIPEVVKGLQVSVSDKFSIALYHATLEDNMNIWWTLKKGGVGIAEDAIFIQSENRVVRIAMNNKVPKIYAYNFWEKIQYLKKAGVNSVEEFVRMHDAIISKYGTKYHPDFVKKIISKIYTLKNEGAVNLLSANLDEVLKNVVPDLQKEHVAKMYSGGFWEERVSSKSAAPKPAGPPIGEGPVPAVERTAVTKGSGGRAPQPTAEIPVNSPRTVGDIPATSAAEATGDVGAKEAVETTALKVEAPLLENTLNRTMSDKFKPVLRAFGKFTSKAVLTIGGIFLTAEMLDYIMTNGRPMPVSDYMDEMNSFRTRGIEAFNLRCEVFRSMHDEAMSLHKQGLSVDAITRSVLSQMAPKHFEKIMGQYKSSPKFGAKDLMMVMNLAADELVNRGVSPKQIVKHILEGLLAMSPQSFLDAMEDENVALFIGRHVPPNELWNLIKVKFAGVSVNKDDLALMADMKKDGSSSPNYAQAWEEGINRQTDDIFTGIYPKVYPTVKGRDIPSLAAARIKYMNERLNKQEDEFNRNWQYPDRLQEFEEAFGKVAV